MRIGQVVTSGVSVGSKFGISIFNSGKTWTWCEVGDRLIDDESDEGNGEDPGRANDGPNAFSAKNRRQPHGTDLTCVDDGMEKRDPTGEDDIWQRGGPQTLAKHRHLNIDED